MATIYPTGHGGSGATSTDCTATNANVLETKTAITSNSNDSPAQGTLPLAAVRLSAGGSLQINGVDSFSTSQSLTTPNTVVFNFNVTAKTGQPWGGLYIRYRTDRFPNSITDGTECGYFSLTGSTYTFSAVEATTTYYFRAWNFFRYNETITSPQTYPLIEYGTYVSHACTIYSHPVPYVLSYGGSLTSNTTGLVTVPAGYTHAEVLVQGVGGWSGYSYWYIYSHSSGTTGNETRGARSGGGGGQSNIVNLNVSSGQTLSWNIGKAGTAGDGTFYSPDNTHWGRVAPFSQGTSGNTTYLYHNGNTYSAAAGNNGWSDDRYASKPGGSRPGGGQGGAANNTLQGTGGAGSDGTLFHGIYYGGSGCGCGESYMSWSSSYDRNYMGVQGYKGATNGTYGHGGNASTDVSPEKPDADKPQPGAIIIYFT